MLGTLHIKSRPLRFGLLVDLNDRSSIEQGLAVNSTVWGGAFNPLIPIFKRVPPNWTDKPFRPPRAHEIFAGYLKAFDPDVLVNCIPADLPAFVKADRRPLVSATQIWDPDFRRAFQPTLGVGILELLGLIFEEHFQFVEKFPHEVSFPALPKKHRLFWGAVFGIVPETIDQAVRKHFSDALGIRQDQASFGLLEEFGNTPRLLFPRRITAYGLTEVPRSFRWNHDNLFFMDANKTLDLLDYWNLRAAGRRVVPVPRQFKDDNSLSQTVVGFLKSAVYRLPTNPSIEMSGTFIRSRSVTMDEMQAYSKAITASSVDLKFSLQHWYPRIWDDWARDKDHVEPPTFYSDEKEIDIPDDSRKLRFTTLMPGFLEQFATDNARVANDVEAKIFGSSEYLASVIPPMAGENVMRAVVGLGRLRDEWRIGHEGLIRLVKYKHSIYWTVPHAQDVFFAWLKDMGWNPEASSAGLIATQMQKQLDGWIAWITERGLTFLEGMSTGKEAADGESNQDTPASKYANRGADQVRIWNELNHPDLRMSGKDVFKHLVERDVFVVGYEMKCPRCFRQSWHSLKDLDAKLICPKCLHTYETKIGITQGKWRYKTTGPFSIGGFADGAYCVLASIHFIARQLHHLSLTPAMSFIAKKAGKELEADFGSLWREANIKGISEGVLFGECKTFGEFKAKDFAKMGELADEFPGAILIFSTLRKTLTETEKAQIRRIAVRGRKYWKEERPINPVCVLTAHELLNHIGPPYCWEALAVKDKFRAIVGVMEFCNATQQIHLGLSDWREDWHNTWEKRRLKKAAALSKAP